MGGAARQLVAQLPQAPGVYRFLDGQGQVLYVGRAARLRSRVACYWTNLRGRRHLLRMVGRIARIEALTCDSEHEAAWLERNLLERARPRWNRTSGTEVPVFIRLDDRARLPGLRVVHSTLEHPGGRYFGPYLGGASVRLAVSGLHRALPLAYAGEAIRGSGVEMARIRGVAPADRHTLVAALCGVLNREPSTVATVREGLVAQRDRASSRLAFELAAQVQAEIEAIEWIVAEQKVALAEVCDFDVHGWADEVLVRFEIRGGRLCAWSASVCSEAAAIERVALTPPAWAAFAQRNAALAARLANSAHANRG
jgi:excinuclease ABC subunit C